MTLRVHIDFETGSACDLKKSGVAAYAEDPTTRIWGFAWGFSPYDVQTWRPGCPPPVALLHHIASLDTVVAHNASFERIMWNKVLRERYEPTWPELKIEQQDCTMARAAAMTLPQGLEALAKVLNQKNLKDEAGSASMRRMMKPRKINPDGTCVWWDDEETYNLNMLYCEQDVRTEIETDGLVPQLSAYEREVWKFDQLINDRGVQFDLNMATRGCELVDIAARKANERVRELTNGVVSAITNTGAIAAWINSRGIETVTFQKGDHDDILELAAEIDDKAVKAVVELRRDANKTSTAKYARILQCACADGRVRQLFNYHGAGPGRWAGRLVQVQNLPRVDEEREATKVSFAVNLLTDRAMPVSEVYDLIALGIGEPTLWASKSLRSTIVAAEGKKLVSGDFTNIEGRVNAWLSGEDWKLSAFRAYDAKTGPDLYRLGAAKICGVDVSRVTSAQRQAQGKVPELACGYQGGVGAFVTMGATYLLKPEDFVPPVQATATAQEWNEVAIRYAKSPRKHGLPEDQWTAISLIVRGWRAAHPNIMQGWWDIQDAALAAIDVPNHPFFCYGGRVQFLCSDGWLYCQLPSKRVLCYASPFIKKSVDIFVNAKGEEYERETRGVFFYGWSHKYGWSTEHTYGGKLCENVVQAVSRCILVEKMFAVEHAGYPVVMHVHDEIVSEVDDHFGSAKEYEQIMSVLPTWAEGLPLSAKAWQDKRYVK